MESAASHTTVSLANMLGGRLDGCDLPISGVNSIADAGPNEITFISNPAYARKWAQCDAAAAVISSGLEVSGHDPQHRALIVVENAELAMGELLRMFAPPAAVPEPGVHATAFVHPSATIGQGARIGAHVSVDRAAVIGRNVTLHPGVRVGADVCIGDDCEIHANCVIEAHCVLGRSVVLHGNVTIGADGFGYRPAADGRSLVKVPHIGNVQIEDHVEIGANTCVDRAKFSSTVIGTGTKIDNLVQIAHNCRIGRWCVIAGQSGLAGSVTVGDFVQMGAKAGAAEGVTIGDRARIGAKAGVMKDVPPGMSVLGLPAEDARIALRQAAAIRRLPDLISELSREREKEP